MGSNNMRKACNLVASCHSVSSFSKTSFLDFLAREKLKNDVFEKNPQGESSPAKFLKNVLFGLFGPRKAQVRSQHGLELATLKSDVVEKPSDFNLMTCLFRVV